jgi:hypothetical protein
MTIGSSGNVTGATTPVTPARQVSRSQMLLGTGLTVSGNNAVVNLDPASSFTFVSGAVSQKLSTDFVVSGGVLQQNAVNLAKSYGFNTTNFTTSGGTGPLTVNAIGVNTLIAGNTFNLGSSVFASSTTNNSTTQAYLALSSAGLVAGDNFAAPVNTAVFASTGITLTNSTSGAQAIFNSFGIKLWNGSGTAQVTISVGSGFLAQNAAGTSYVQINSSGAAIVGGTLTLNLNGATTTIGNASVFGLGVAGLQVVSNSNGAAAYAVPGILQGINGAGTIGTTIGFNGTNATASITNGSSGITLTAASGSTTIRATDLPSSNPGSGAKQFWYDPSDGNRVKFAA